MRVALMTGIFPPDIGGPATHAVAVREEFECRGHNVTVVTLWDGAHVDQSPGVVRLPRRWPWPMRFAGFVWWLVRHRRSYDVVYANTLLPEAVSGARLARRPVVVKVVGDHAWERASRLGITSLDFIGFQQKPPRGVRVRLMRGLRTWAVVHATAVTVPSQYMRDVVRGWVGDGVEPVVIPNAVRVSLGATSHVRRGSGPLRAIFVGRLIALKRVDRLVQAVAMMPGVTLEVIGDGPELEALRRYADNLSVSGRIRFLGALPHEEALRRIEAADVLVLPSEIENLSHVAIEALAIARPVIAAAVGGMREVVDSGRTGLLLERTDAEAIAGALARLRDDPDLHQRLSEAAASEAARWSLSNVAGRLVDLLAQARVGDRG